MNIKVPLMLAFLGIVGGGASAQVNLLPQGNFERPGVHTGWAEGFNIPNNGQFKVVSEDGKSWLRIENRDAGRPLDTVHAYVRVTPQIASLVVSVRLKATNLKIGKEGWHTARVALMFEGGSFGFPPEVPELRAGSDWVTKSVELKVPKGATRLNTQPAMFYCTGVFEIADLTVTPHMVAPTQLGDAALPAGIALDCTFRRGHDGFTTNITSEPLLTEYGSIYFGNDAYASEEPKYRQFLHDLFRSGMLYNSSENRLDDYANMHKIQQLFRTNTWRSWRTAGLPGGLRTWSWMQDALKEINGPTLAWIAGPAGAYTAKDHHFRAGQTIENQIVLVNDTRQPQDFTATWTAAAGGKEVGKGTERGRLAVSETRFVPVQVTAPAEEAGGKADGQVTLTATIGATTHRDALAFRVFGKDRPAEGEIAVVDPRRDDPQDARRPWLHDPGLGVGCSAPSGSKQLQKYGVEVVRGLCDQRDLPLEGERKELTRAHVLPYMQLSPPPLVPQQPFHRVLQHHGKGVARTRIKRVCLDQKWLIGPHDVLSFIGTLRVAIPCASASDENALRIGGHFHDIAETIHSGPTKPSGQMIPGVEHRHGKPARLVEHGGMPRVGRGLTADVEPQATPRGGRWLAELPPVHPVLRVQPRDAPDRRPSR
ncbi:MAG: hypothetical protein IMZ65_02310 [Planctomycetes bacterium]|nr:hypothetical protein [Planctomycetota bacterium]